VKSKVCYLIILLSVILSRNINSQELIQSISNDFSDNERIGFDVEINTSVTLIAIASVPTAEENSSDGRVQIYKRNGSSYEKLNTEITTDIDSSFFATKISLSGDGSVIAVGAESFDNDKEAVGAVYIFEILNDEIIPLDTLFGEFQFGAFGTSIDLNESGDVLVVGSKAQAAYVFQKEEKNYNLLYEIESEFFSADFGRLVRINSEGTRVAILGLSFHGGNPRPDVQIFNINSSSYALIESPIISESSEKRIEEFTFSHSGNLINLRINQDLSTFHNYEIGDSIIKREDQVDANLSFHSHIRFADNENFLATSTTSGVHFYRYDNEKWVSTLDVIPLENFLIDLEISQNKEIAVFSSWGLDDMVHIYNLNPTNSSLNIEPAGLLIYPNPSNDFIIIESTEASKFSIYNNTGSLLKFGQIMDGKIDIQNLENGMYFLELENKSKQKKEILKFLVKR